MGKIATKNLNLDQNPNLKPRKKPWVGPIDFPKTNNIQNNPKTLKVGDLLVWNGQPLSQDFLRTIDEDQRDEIAKDVYNYLLDYPFDKFDFGLDEVDRSWKALCKFEPKTEIIDGITYISNSSTSGSQIYRHFFPNIIKVRGDNRPSIYDVLKDKEKLWSTIRNRFGNTLLYNDDTKNGIPVEYPMNISLSQICVGAKNSGNASMASIFKCGVSKAIYKKYIKEESKVLDFSSGFGGRLLGLMSLQKKDVFYAGYEPNNETYSHLLELIGHFKFNAKIKMSGSETDDLFDEKFDFVFSSPPYHLCERYSDEETQCYNKYPDYNDWLEFYWRKTVKNIKMMMNTTGHFAVNIGGNANDLMKKLETDLNKIIVEEGFELVDRWNMLTAKSHLSGKKGDENKKHKLEGIFFYRMK